MSGLACDNHLLFLFGYFPGVSADILKVFCEKVFAVVRIYFSREREERVMTVYLILIEVSAIESRGGIQKIILNQKYYKISPLAMGIKGQCL